MDKWAIEFPNLGIYLKHVPKSFSLFGRVDIALYAVAIMIGMFGGLLIAINIAKKTEQKTERYWDLFIYGVIVSIICARAYYVIFEWDSYKGDLFKIINIRQGGLAIYGGIIGIAITLFSYSKIKKLNSFLIADTVAPALVFGQIVGRWGNFFNREAFGEYTNSLFAMKLPTSMVRSSDITDLMRANMVDGAIMVHPTFFYEGALNLILFVLILLFWKKKKFNGEVALWYFTGYGIIRFFVEGLRTDQLQIGSTGIAVSQVLSAVLMIAAASTIVVFRIKKSDDGTIDSDED